MTNHRRGSPNPLARVGACAESMCVPRAWTPPQGDALKIQVLHAVLPVGFGLAAFHSAAPQTTPWAVNGRAAGSGAAPE